MTEEIKRSILTHLYQINRALRQHRSSGSGIGELTLHQFQALLFIKRQQPVKMSDLAEELQITAGTATILVDRLWEAGWLERQADEQDRRITLVTLSAEAGRKLTALANRRQERVGRILDHISDKDLAELDRILGLVERSVTESR